MHESFSSYLKIISFGIKQKRIIEFVNLKFQKDTDRFRRKYLKDYLALEMTPENALVKLIPNDNFDFKTLGSLEEHLDEFVTKKSKEKHPSITNPYPVEFGLDRAVCRILFAICRRYKPDIVVETGVANGFSTSYFLSAMFNEKKGKLISVENIVRPWQTEQGIGLAIPKQLRQIHELILVKSGNELQRLFDELSSIDIFMHDSSHTYQNMKKEFNLAWSYIKKGGFLLSDDVSQNDAFLEFANLIEKTPIIIKKDKGGHFGIIQK